LLFGVWFLFGILRPELFSQIDEFRYPPAIIGVFGLLMCFGPYYVVRHEDSFHGFMYFFAYALLVVFAVQDIQLIRMWLAANGP
jgi:hypothetical protein